MRSHSGKNGRTGRSTRARRIAAYHEAGHAILAYFRREAGSTLAVVISGEHLAAANAGRAPENRAAGLHLGRRTLPTFVGRQVDTAKLKAVLALYLGGFAAERVLARKPVPTIARGSRFFRLRSGALGDAEDDSDWGAAGRLAMRALEVDRDTLLRDAARRCQQEGRSVAKADIDRVLAEFESRVYALLDEAMRDAHEVVETHWSAVQTVARALLRRGRVEGDEVELLIERTLAVERA